MEIIKKFCLITNGDNKDYLLVQKDIIYKPIGNKEVTRVGDRIRNECNGSLVYKNNSGKFVKGVTIIDTDDDRDSLRKRWEDSDRRVRLNANPYTPSTASTKIPAKKTIEVVKEPVLKKQKIEKVNQNAADHFRRLLPKSLSPSQQRDATSNKSELLKTVKRQTLNDITNKEKKIPDNTPLRPPSIATSQSNSTRKDAEEGLLYRKGMRKMAGPAWKKRIEDTLDNVLQEVKELKEAKNDKGNKIKNNQAVAKNVNMKETIVIENGEQITTIDNIIFTSTQYVNVLKQKTMKKRLCSLVQVVWTPEIIKKKYLDPPKDMDDYLLINGRDKLKFERLCLHFQNRKTIDYDRGGEDDLELHSMTWLGRRCVELRAAWKKKYISGA